ASSTEKQGIARGVATPYLRRISFAWYSWIFIVDLCRQAAVVPSRAGTNSLYYSCLPASLDRSQLPVRTAALPAEGLGAGRRSDLSTMRSLLRMIANGIAAPPVTRGHAQV